jgi:hypothetical protein
MLRHSRQFIQSRWFGLADLICAFLGAAAWVLGPGAGPWPLLIVLLPWIARLSSGRFPFRRTVFDLPVGIFLLTAGAGVWAAYQR